MLSKKLKGGGQVRNQKKGGDPPAIKLNGPNATFNLASYKKGSWGLGGKRRAGLTLSKRRGGNNKKVYKEGCVLVVRGDNQKG